MEITTALLAVLVLDMATMMMTTTMMTTMTTCEEEDEENIHGTSSRNQRSKDGKGILEPFIIGTEPYNNNVKKLDGLSSINNDSISGTGSLLIQ